jgi:tetratricopeptide (TPR) repeat protein
LLFVPLGVCFLFFSAPEEALMNIRIRQSLVFLTLSVLIILPITVRNYIKVNDFVLVTADAGKVFYHGNGKGASALDGLALVDEGFSEESTHEPDYAHVLYRKTARAISGRHLSPSESSKFWFQKTFAEIVQDPMAYLLLQMKKFFYFFNDYEMHYIASAYKEYKQSLSFPLIRYGVITALGILGMILSLKTFRRLFLIYGIIFLYLISGLLFLVQSRYRLPAVPYLCLFAGFAVSCLKHALYQKRYRSVMAYLTVVVLSFSMVRFVYRVEINAMDRWQKATKIYYLIEARPAFQMKKYGTAIAKLDRCLALAPNFSPAYNLRGKSHGMLGNSQDALRDFLTVIRLSPNMAEGYKNIGLTYLILGKKEAAKAYLQKAAAFASDDNKIKEALEHLNKP